VWLALWQPEIHAHMWPICVPLRTPPCSALPTKLRNTELAWVLLGAIWRCSSHYLARAFFAREPAIDILTS
jgi:hypothetical protein